MNITTNSHTSKFHGNNRQPPVSVPTNPGNVVGIDIFKDSHAVSCQPRPFPDLGVPEAPSVGLPTPVGLPEESTEPSLGHAVPVDISGWKSKLNPGLLGRMEARGWELAKAERFSAALEGEFSGPDINRFKEDHGFQLNHIGGNIYTARGMDLPGLQSLAEFDTVTEIEASIYTEQPHGRAGPLV